MAFIIIRVLTGFAVLVNLSKNLNLYSQAICLWNDFCFRKFQNTQGLIEVKFSLCTEIRTPRRDLENRKLLENGCKNKNQEYSRIPQVIDISNLELTTIPQGMLK